MITKFSWRRAVAVPAVVTLALGGALLSTTAAQAVAGDLVVSSPATGATTNSRTVTVTGSATPGAAIEVFTDSTETTSLGTAAADATSGAYTAALTPYADDATPAQSVFVVESFPDEADETAAVDFFLPNLDVTSPEAGATTASRTVEVTGTGIPTATVNLSPSVGDAVIGQISVGADRTWTGSVTFPADATPEQTITVDQVLGGSGRGQVVLPVVLPAVVTPPTTPTALDAPVITAPTQGSTVTGTEVTFEGTGTPGADIGLLVTPTDTVSTLADDPAARIVVDENGDWTVTAALQPGAYTAVALQVLLDAAGQPVLDENGLPVASDDSTPVDFTLEAAAVALDAPVITSPTQGQVVVGDQVTFEGTGTPGSNILLAVVPTDQLDELEAAENGRAAAAAVPADPADPIVVDAAGNWTVTLALTPDDYTAAAVSFLLGADGLPVLDAAGQPIVSAPSADVAFSLVAAVTPAALPATPIAGTTGLAYTGSEGTEAAIGIGAAVLLLGSTLMVLARRRAKLATSDVAGE
ncbi:MULTISPECIES: hypothetical protein [unclassified Frigoribacterium]|uniref:hypothetical protein n=1 Tax=unclassified Frigoribacterium TaxID=2627005 RepID=UPI0006FC25BA|nr:MULTISPECIES: hypothetical protein [unclassified Frigoribacterium]KQO46727.1 hypothetical protein ASF07_03265 [Frigoribacterium sp. Leaf254]KQT38820.1 hypothetical protein ASG28_03265 [Frigoribacterium sp. Leaf415]